MILTLEEFEIMVDSPSPAYKSPSAKDPAAPFETVLTIMGRTEGNSWRYVVYDNCRDATSIKK